MTAPTAMASMVAVPIAGAGVTAGADGAADGGAATTVDVGGAGGAVVGTMAVAVG